MVQSRIYRFFGCLRLPYSYQLEKIMATLADIQASQAAEDAEVKTLILAFQAAQASIAASATQLAALQAQVAAGSPITSANLDAIKADMDATTASMAAVLPAPTPAASAPAAPAPSAP